MSASGFPRASSTRRRRTGRERRGRFLEQRLGIGLREPFHPEVFEPRLPRRPFLIAGGEQQDDRLRLDAPGDERDDVAGRGVEPVSVLDDEQERRHCRSVGEELEDAERDQKCVGSRSRLDAERHPEGGALWRRQRLGPAQYGPEQLVEAGEGEPRLRLDRRRREDREPLARCVAARLGEKRRLADARLALQHQRGPAVADTIHESMDTSELGSPPDQCLDHRHPGIVPVPPIPSCD